MFELDIKVPDSSTVPPKYLGVAFRITTLNLNQSVNFYQLTTKIPSTSEYLKLLNLSVSIVENSTAHQNINKINAIIF